MIDAHRAAGNPVEAETILAGEIRLGPFRVTTKAIWIDSGYTDQERERDGPDSNASDDLFGEAKLSAQKTINCGAD